MQAFTADNFNLHNFCHALHREEREEERIEHMKPIRFKAEAFSGSGYAARQAGEVDKTPQRATHDYGRVRA